MRTLALTALLLLHSSTSYGQEAPPAQEVLPPLTACILCQLNRDPTDYELRSLFQEYASNLEGRPTEGTEYYPPGLTVRYQPFYSWEQLVIEVHDYDTSYPYLEEIYALTKIGRTRGQSRSRPGKYKKLKGAAFQSMWEVQGYLEEWDIGFQATWDSDDFDKLERIVFYDAESAEVPANDVCSACEYPPPILTDTRWKSVEKAFEDYTYLHLIFSLTELDAKDWQDLEQAYGFVKSDGVLPMYHKDKLHIRIAEQVEYIELDQDSGWESQVLEGLDGHERCPVRYLGNREHGCQVITLEQGGREREGSADTWYMIRNSHRPEDSWDYGQNMGASLRRPHCREGECVDGEGLFAWSDGCEFKGRFVHGEPVAGEFSDRGKSIEKIGDWENLESVKAEIRAAEQARVEAEAQAVAKAEAEARERAELEALFEASMAPAPEPDRPDRIEVMNANLDELFELMRILATTVTDMYRIIVLSNTDLDAYNEERYWFDTITVGALEKIDRIRESNEIILAGLSGGADCGLAIELIGALDGNLHEYRDLVNFMRSAQWEGYSTEEVQDIGTRIHDMDEFLLTFIPRMSAAKRTCAIDP